MYLEKINQPQDLKSFSLTELKKLSTEIRKLIIETCLINGGHLAGSLGAVELVVALHKVFNSPIDKIIFDVGHQAYAHKILTGRRGSFSSLRQKNGLAAFPLPSESPHDAFIAGHAGNSLSAGLGIALANYYHQNNSQTIAVIGDGSLNSGLAAEALNHLGVAPQNTRLLIIINDNQYSIDPCAGSIAKNNAYQKLITSYGLDYSGPIDGHNLTQLIKIFSQKKLQSGIHIVHVITQKGRGYQPAEENPTRYHNLCAQQARQCEQNNDHELCARHCPLNENHYHPTKVIEQTLLRIASRKKNLVAVTPAMLQSSGFLPLAKKYPEKVIDTGIAESHSVTLAAGLATGGLRPIVHLYASFAQRALDQIIHDMALPCLPVTLILDRSGLVGADGTTHQGQFILSQLMGIPHLQIISPVSPQEFASALNFALTTSQKPTAICIPKAFFPQKNLPLISKINEKLPFNNQPQLLHHQTNFFHNSLQSSQKNKKLFISLKDQIHSRTKKSSPQAKLLLFSTGLISGTLENISLPLTQDNFSHYHLPQIKPLPTAKILHLISQIQPTHLATLEENAFIGGFGQQINQLILENMSSSSLPRILNLALPDNFILQATREEQLAETNLNPEKIQSQLATFLSR